MLYTAAMDTNTEQLVARLQHIKALITEEIWLARDQTSELPPDKLEANLLHAATSVNVAINSVTTAALLAEFRKEATDA